MPGGEAMAATPWRRLPTTMPSVLQQIGLGSLCSCFARNAQLDLVGAARSGGTIVIFVGTSISKSKEEKIEMHIWAKKVFLLNSTF